MEEEYSSANLDHHPEATGDDSFSGIFESNVEAMKSEPISKDKLLEDADNLKHEAPPFICWW